MKYKIVSSINVTFLFDRKKVVDADDLATRMVENLGWCKGLEIIIMIGSDFLWITLRFLNDFRYDYLVKFYYKRDAPKV